MYKQPKLTKQWNYNVFVRIGCSYFRYTCRLFLGCALFVARCNIIRVSWETKKKKIELRKKCIEEFVWETSLFWLQALLSMSFFVTFFFYSPHQVMYLLNGPYKDRSYCDGWYSEWLHHEWTLENMSVFCNLMQPGWHL